MGRVVQMAGEGQVARGIQMAGDIEVQVLGEVTMAGEIKMAGIVELLPHDEVSQLVIMYSSLESVHREKLVEIALPAAKPKAKNERSALDICALSLSQSRILNFHAAD